MFIRGFRVARSFGILPRRLEAAAGLDPDPGGYDYDPDKEVVSIPGNSQVRDSVRLLSVCSGSDVFKFRDPLHLLLDYIAEVSTSTSVVSFFWLSTNTPDLKVNHAASNRF